MFDVIGICNLHDGPHLGPLTKQQPLCTVPFLGRYEIIDFVLSNFSNSRINRTFILVENDMYAVKDHIKDGQVWINNTKTGFQRTFINEKAINNKKFNTDVQNLKENWYFFEKECSEYVVVAPPFFLAAIDYRDMIEEHIASKSDISVAYIRVDNKNDDFINCDTLVINKSNKEVLQIGINNGKREENISLETFVFSRDVFDKIIQNSDNVSRMFTLRQNIKYYLENKKFKVHAFKFEGHVVPILSYEGYVKQSFNLLSYQNRQKLFLDNWPIYTVTHNTPPTFYSENASVKNSFIANGCIIKGKVENSILSRNVVIEDGAEVKNCIMFSAGKVAKNIKMNYVLASKRVNISEEDNVFGEEEDVLFIPLGAKI